MNRKAPISQTGSPEAGYTLTELLVAFAIMALLAGAFPVAYRSAIPGAEFTSDMRLLQSELRLMRGQAVAAQKVERLELDDAGAAFRVSGEKKAPIDDRLEGRFHIQPILRDGIRSGQDKQIAFFPDGSSSGGTLTYELDSREGSLRVSWLTGEVTRVD